MEGGIEGGVADQTNAIWRDNTAEVQCWRLSVSARAHDKEGCRSISSYTISWKADKINMDVLSVGQCYTVSQKNVHLFIIQITLSKVNQF